MKIWQRYIFRELLKVFLFFLFCFYVLYVIIDYSTHFQEFLQGKHIPIFKICQYYLYQFVKRADILLPLGLMVAAIKVLCQMNTHKEFLALQTAGVRQRTLLSPLFVLGVFCTFACLSLNEFVIPHSLNFIDRFYDAHLRPSFRGMRKDPMRIAHLEDHSKLIYQYYDKNRDALFDVFWIQSPDEIWRIKYLNTTHTPPTGEWVDHLSRSNQGILEKIASYPSYTFENLKWNPQLPRIGYFPYENHSLRQLKQLLEHPTYVSSFEKKELLTQYLFKWVMPFLNILVLMAIVPPCIRYRKAIPQFFIYAFAIFALLGFIALMDAAVILGENATLSPYLAILTPFIFLFTLLSVPFYRYAV